MNNKSIKNNKKYENIIKIWNQCINKNFKKKRQWEKIAKVKKKNYLIFTLKKCLLINIKIKY